MIYVITAVHNRFNITKKFIANLKLQSYKNIHLVLVDDGSNDGTSEMVKNTFPNVTILKGDGNLWWGGSLHKAYKWLCSQDIDNENFVMIANDDTNFNNDYIEKAVNLLKENENTLISGCGYSVRNGKLIDAVSTHDFKTGNGIGILKENNYGNCASTRSLFLRIKDFKKIGGFHPILLPHYASDFEWTLRASKKGFNIKSFSELKYLFDEGTTGDNKIENITFKKLFSKRSNLNPFYKLNFIILSTPIINIPSHLFFQMKRYFKKLSFLRI